MGKKIPMWQTVLVMLVMIGLLVWSIVKDAGGEPHIALILADCVRGYHRVSEWLEVGVFGAGNPGFHQPLDAGNSDSGDSRRDYRFVDGGRNDSFDDVLRH